MPARLRDGLDLHRAPPPKTGLGRYRAHGLWGNCMGETLLLLSCGAAFITGLVIAAASLFG
jgi:hypothetical protein